VTAAGRGAAWLLRLLVATWKGAASAQAPLDPYYGISFRAASAAKSLIWRVADAVVAGLYFSRIRSIAGERNPPLSHARLLPGWPCVSACDLYRSLGVQEKLDIHESLEVSMFITRFEIDLKRKWVEYKYLNLI
jgi:hypothetical protein